MVGLLLSIIPYQGEGHIEDSEPQAQAFRTILQAPVRNKGCVEVEVQKRHALSCYFKGDYNPTAGLPLVAEKTTSATDRPPPTEESTASEDSASEDAEDEEYLEEEGELIVEEAC